MLNRIVIQGRLTKDPVKRTTAGGLVCASFTLACDRDYKDKTTGERECDFIDCVAWGNTADFVCSYFGKGQQAVVDGRLQIRPWTDKDGNKRRQTEISVYSIYFCGSKHVEEPGADDFDEEDSEDIPF